VLVPQDFSRQGLAAEPASLSVSAMASDHQEIVELVRRVRHDANNPLTAALGHIQLLLDDPAVTNDEVRDSLRVVENELRRLIGILRQLNEIK
jgi:signal transduction histidine kinase